MTGRTQISAELATQITVALVQRHNSVLGQGPSAEQAAKQVTLAFDIIHPAVQAKHER